MSTKICEKFPLEFTLRKCPLEFPHFEKSVHENSLSTKVLHGTPNLINETVFSTEKKWAD